MMPASRADDLAEARRRRTVVSLRFRTCTHARSALAPLANWLGAT